MKRWMALLGSVAAVCSMAGCSSSPPASAGPFASLARHVVADLAAGNYTAVEGKFDPAMMKASRTVPLPKAWAACQHDLGTYRSHGAPTFARQGQFDVERVPVQWGHGPGTVTITFNPSQTIAGLHCYGAP
jgi:hypothetical protein